MWYHGTQTSLIVESRVTSVAWHCHGDLLLMQEDCPFFETIFDFSKSAAAMSVGAAVMLNHNLAEVAVNWSGGLHHARMDKAEGFCYINDIVLGILELLKYHPRVMYADIDIHHGDGVEEAFLHTNRVMTVSFHKYDRGDKDRNNFFFPGTGDVCDIGPDDAHHEARVCSNCPVTTWHCIVFAAHKHACWTHLSAGDFMLLVLSRAFRAQCSHFVYRTTWTVLPVAMSCVECCLVTEVLMAIQGYAVNVPLTDGLDDEMFVNDVFIPVIDGVMEHYQPSVIVLQCGADSLAGDKIGKFNLTTLGHAEAGRYLRQMYPNVPVMMLGGGGYTISNVARTWSYETISMLGYQDEQISYYCPIVWPCAVCMQSCGVIMPVHYLMGIHESTCV